MLETNNYLKIGRVKRLNEKLVAIKTPFGWSLQGYMQSASALFSTKIILEVIDISDPIRNFCQLKSLVIEFKFKDASNLG